MKRALITGVFGQDGSYLSELLSEDGYEVHGIARTPLSEHAKAVSAHLHAKGVRPVLHECDLSDAVRVSAVIETVRPDECYHLAAAHYPSEVSAAVGRLAESAGYVWNVTSAVNVLTACAHASPETRIVLAGSCLVWAATTETPQRETMPFVPASLYGFAKASVAKLARYFREGCGLHVSVAILYNHESPRRRNEFVSKKIVRSLTAVRRGESAGFEIDNAYSVRDWGYARDYANGMRLMCRQAVPRDLILSTGTARSVGEFLGVAAELAGIPDWQRYVQVRRVAPTAMPTALVGDPTAAMTVLGWRHSTSFRELIALMLACEERGSLD